MQTLVQYNDEDSAYNSIWRHDRELKVTAKGIIELNKQIKMQATHNNISTKVISELNNATNTLFYQLDQLEKAAPEISELISKVTVNIYRDADLLRDLKLGFEKGILNHHASGKMNLPGTSIFTKLEISFDYDRIPPCKILDFHINQETNEMSFLFSYSIIDWATHILESVAIKEFVDNSTYKIFPDKLYAVYNATANCTRLISQPNENKELVDIKCITQNLPINIPNIPFKYMQLTDQNSYSWFEPQIMMYLNVYVQCFSHNITIQGFITQQCPKYPFMLPVDYNYQTGSWTHRFDFKETKIEAGNLSIDDIAEIERYDPWLTTFQANQNRFKELKILNDEIVEISNRKTDVWINFKENIGTLFNLYPILFSGISISSIVGIFVLILLCYLYTKRDPLIEIAQTSMLASVMGNHTDPFNKVPEAETKNRQYKHKQSNLP